MGGGCTPSPSWEPWVFTKMEGTRRQSWGAIRWAPFPGRGAVAPALVRIATGLADGDPAGPRVLEGASGTVRPCGPRCSQQRALLPRSTHWYGRLHTAHKCAQHTQTCCPRRPKGPPWGQL